MKVSKIIFLIIGMLGFIACISSSIWSFTDGYMTDGFIMLAFTVLNAIWTTGFFLHEV